MSDVTPVQGRALPNTPGDDKWETLAREGEFGALSSVRSTAGKWAGTVGSLIALLGLAGFLKGEDPARALAGGWRYAAGAALLVAAVSMLDAVRLAARASQGTPVKVLATGPEFRRAHMEAARHAASDLRRSQRRVFAGSAFFLLLLGLLWYAPRSEPPQPLLLVQDDKGAYHCGRFDRTANGGVVLRGGQDEQPIRQARTTVVVASCGER